MTLLYGEALAVTRCRECGGTGRNGTLGGYALLCRACDGTGHRMVLYRAVHETGDTP